MLLAKVSQGDQRPTFDGKCGPWHEEPRKLPLPVPVMGASSKVYHIQHGVSIPNPYT